MRHLVVSLAASAFLALGLASTAVSAAPANRAGIAVPDSNLSDVRMSRRQRMMRRSMMGGSRRYAPSQAGNARDTQRPPSQQNQGMTTGGPRY